MTNQGINTVIAGAGGQPISLGTTADPGSMTGFHDLVNVYSETPLNIGFVNGTIISDVPAPGTIASKAIADAAAADAMAAFIDLRDRLGGIDVGIDPVTGNGPGELGGRTLAPGIYKSAPGSYAITNLDLTLDPQGNPDAVWVFQMPLSTLSVGIPGPAGTRSVNLLPPGQPKNVFWQVGSTATINPAGGGTMVGTIMAFAAINISTATAGNILPIVTLNGRALALGASTTMVNTVINVPAP
ncbi:MAG TPA: ice-binding family protein [Candidatus Glassbacteria bacterium]|nr:ice-binding family protein [Candidatus Glassbacteria bacterium]